MLTGLMLTALLMGLAGMPHCVAMCGTACAACLPKGVSPWSLLGRCLGYMGLGAVAASASGLLAQWGRQVQVLEPFWLLAQAAAVLLGLWLLLQGRIPMLLDQWGHRVHGTLRKQARVWIKPESPWRSLWPVCAGLLWAALPCGLLYSALTVAALAPRAWGGALVMLCFALPGAAAVWLTPAVLRRWGVRRAEGLTATQALPITWLAHPASTLGAAARSGAPTVEAPAAWLNPKWAVRASGLCLAVAAAWGLYHHVMDQWRIWCA